MDVHQLNIFISAAQYLNFTEAAKHMFVAQSAVSHHIAELEKELGTKLFFRNKNGISLTPAGETLLMEAFKITTMVGKTSTKIQKMASGAKGELSIGFVFEPIVDCFTEHFRQFYEKYPEINIHFNSYDSIKIARMMENMELDICFARLITINKKEEVYWRLLYSDPLYVGMRKSHQLAGLRKVKLNMLAHEKIILMTRQANPGMFDMIHHLFMSRGIPPLIQETTNDLMTSIMMARIGMGLLILPERFKHMIPEELDFIPIDEEDACHQIGITWHKDNPNPSVKLFLEAFGIDMDEKCCEVGAKV